MNKQIEILLYTKNFEKASKEIETHKGRVIQKFTNNVFVALIPNEFKDSVLKESSKNALPDLDSTSKLMVEAWNELNKKESLLLESKSPQEPIIKWDDKDHEAPKHIDNEPLLKEGFSEIKKKLNKNNLSDALNQTMTGKIVVGIIIVSGPANLGLDFSSAEKLNNILQIMQGIRFLTLSAPASANLSFVYDAHYITVAAIPSPNPCTPQAYPVCEAVFRDPALQQMGYQTGYQGCVDYVNHLIATSPNSNGAYVSFFTKYPLFHFAYQYGINLYMQYSNDGWGPNKINQVFAHESCHIFGAADEYASSGCTCAPSGKLRVPNNNCDNCAYQPKVPCLMNANTLSLCQWSTGQIGWVA